MALSVECILVFLLIQPTILRSMFFFHEFFPRSWFTRVLLATIRDNGDCPCPRCLTPKSKLHLMGFARDIAFRANHLRKYFRGKIEAARRAIYVHGFGIRSKKVEDLLKDTSAVPTIASVLVSLSPCLTEFDAFRMLSLTVLVTILTYTACSSWTSCMSSS